nr:hypothetical protein BaRGS_002821 [Batillaria attramentaria]
MPSSNASSKLLTAVSASVILVVVTNALVVKRSDDNLPDIAVVERHSTEIEQLKASLAALQNSIAETNAKIADTNANVGRLDTNVAFLAFFREGDVGGYHKGMTIKYNTVRYNAGNGYDPVTGLFTAPASGLYAFGIK